MNMEVINKIEAKISELEAQFKKNSDFIASANTAMDKLVSDRSLANAECNKLDGAVQMARGILAEMKAGDAPAQALPCDAEVLEYIAK